MQNRKYSAPFGWQIFAQQLKKLNVPQEMMINKTKWNYILKHKDDSLHTNNLTDVNQLGSWSSFFNKDKKVSTFSDYIYYQINIVCYNIHFVGSIHIKSTTGKLRSKFMHTNSFTI